MNSTFKDTTRWPAVRGLMAGLLAAAFSLAAMPLQAATALADQPLFSNTAVPGNLALALSVEFPTAISRAHTDAYAASSTYLGYFDPNKCYLYNYDSDTSKQYFYPAGAAPADRSCGKQTTTQVKDASLAANKQTTGTYGKWSGNYLNWATMQTIDPFRWALTGGYRQTDTTTTTILEKAWASNQGSESSNFARKSISSTLAGNGTPFSMTFVTRVWALGNKLRFGNKSSYLDNSGKAYSGPGMVNTTDAFELYVRVKVCDPNTSTAGPLESNCVKYGDNYKPEGLMQSYSDRIRYSAFGYLNDGNLLRDGAVLRARQKFIGQNVVVPGSPDVDNANKEWSPTTGIFIANPDPSDATATYDSYKVTVTNSGVMNYLNKFGETSQSYKTYDPVSELYYAAVRYYKNLGNVTAWTPDPSSSSRTTWVDGFPVIPTWDDPIQYACQKNFILGIGDTNSHADKNVSGDGTPTGDEPTKPAEVVADTSTQSVEATNYVGNFQGIANLGTTNPWTGGNHHNSALMGGLAYHTHTVDIRPDNTSHANTIGKQTITTYWLDVLESGAKANNQFYLAAKYGGFTVPSDYNYASTPTDFWANDAQKPLWSTSGDVVAGQPRPDNYYTADRPDLMVSGLTKAFASIASAIKAFTTSFALPSPQVSNSGNSSYSTQYDASNWTGEVSASSLGIDTSGNTSQTAAWSFSSVLATQAGGTGWDSGRRIVTWNTDTKVGVPFRADQIATGQKSALNTTYRSGDDSSNYLEYLRGNQSLETATSEPYRARTSLVGDIVGSKATPVAAPNMPLSDSTNPGYSAFRTKYSSRTPMVYVGSNDGMVHAINGSLTGTDAGKEVFAYVPSALFQGPNNTPSVDGLASRGNPAFTHKYLINATPTNFDIDFGRTYGATGGTDWHTVLIGGLGKGGKSYYALDVTDPTNSTTESKVMPDETGMAARVLWEFTDPDMGFTYGDPVVVKTRAFGWVAIFVSGYNNPDGKGYFFIVNPKTGALLAKVSTGVGTVDAPAGMAYANAFVVNLTNGYADAAYAGDLLGNLWRLDLSSTETTLSAPTQIAFFADSGNVAQPVTSRPLISVQPVSNTRYVFVGTGRMLDNTDISSTQTQSFYALIDGTGPKFQSALPTGVSYPIKRGNLAKVTDLTAGVTVSKTQMGWYFDLGNGTGSVGWRVTSGPTSFYGTVAFSSTLPSGDACNPSGSSRVYVLDFGMGLSKVVDTLNNVVSYMAIAGVVTDLRFVNVSGKDQLLAGTDTGAVKSVPRKPLTPPSMRRLNWREIPVVN